MTDWGYFSQHMKRCSWWPAIVLMAFWQIEKCMIKRELPLVVVDRALCVDVTFLRLLLSKARRPLDCSFQPDLNFEHNCLKNWGGYWFIRNLRRSWESEEVFCCHSVVKFCLTLCDAIDWLQHTRLPCPSRSPGVCSNSCPLSQWCLPTISSSVILFSFHLQSFLPSGSFPMSQLFTSSGLSIGVSALVLLLNIQGLFPLGLTWLISLQFKGLSRVFSNTIVQKHQFFSAQPSLWSNSHMCTWLLEKP